MCFVERTNIYTQTLDLFLWVAVEMKIKYNDHNKQLCPFLLPFFRSFFFTSILLFEQRSCCYFLFPLVNCCSCWCFSFLFMPAIKINNNFNCFQLTRQMCQQKCWKKKKLNLCMLQQQHHKFFNESVHMCVSIYT